MIDFASRRYPFTGFGDDPHVSIKFMVIRRPDDDPHEWAGGDVRLPTFEIRHSNDVVTQRDGQGPMTFTTRIWLATPDDLEALDAVRGRQATLRYAWGLTTRAGGHKATLPDGRSYLVLPDTLLVGVSGRRTERGQQPEAVVTFRRAVGVGTLYDYAHLLEGGYE